MKTRSQLMTAFVVSILFSTITYATTLNQVFQQALKSDSTFQKAQADWMAAKQSLNIARAGYLPSITILGDYSQSNNSTYSAGSTAPPVPKGTTTTSINTHSYSIKANQAIFNFTAWKTISQADASVKAATATYFAASQDLIQRTLSAYFTVLQDYEALRFNEASQNALYQTLITNKEQFRVGLIAITDVYNAQSTYDTTKAKQFALKAKLDTDLENLRVITEQRYTVLNGIRNQLPLATPAPANINSWVNIATKQSYALQAKTYAMLAAKEKIAAANGAFLPNVGAQISYGGGNPTGLSSDNNNTSYGLNLTYTPFAGGANFASSKQARYQYLSASADQQTTYRSVVSGTRQAYLGVSSGIQTIRADQKAIESAALSLEATRAGYKVGTRTMVDILDDTTKLYQTKQSYADDQYKYLNSIVSLKEAAGTLSDKDVKKISRWLSQPVNLLHIKTTSTNKNQRAGNTKANKNKSARQTKKGKKKNSKKTNQTKKQNSAINNNKPNLAYTVQLFATKSKQKAQAFQSSLPKNPLTHILYSKPWYKVTYGQYQDHLAANRAMTKLNGKFKAHRAWVYEIH